MINAAKLAAEEINAAGGLLGRQVEILPTDDGCDPQTGTAAAQKLLVSGIVGVAGGYCSGATIPETAVLDPKGIPFVVAAATNPAVTERGLRTVFRVVGRDDQQGPFAARFLAGPAGARKLAILHDNSTYAKGLAEQTRAGNADLKLGMQIVFFDAITPGERDYTSALTKIKGSGADTLYFTGYLAEAGLIVRQAKDLGLPVRLVGGDATNDPTVIRTAGPAAEGFIATTSPLPAFLPAAAAFSKAYTERYGSGPGPYSVYEYDAVKVLADAITRAGSTDSTKVVEALRATRYDGVTGQIAFDAKGDRQNAVYVTAIVRDGKFVPHKKLDDAGHWVDG
jgi:ABC-type branched-subunit amino acid transport system substrate-binding protein